MKITKQLIALAIILSTAMGVMAQNTSSPYSRYGYGILSDNATSTQRAMGGVGYAMNSGRQINVMNPASYASIDSLTFLFDMGISGSALWSEENGNHGSSFGGGLDYITMQFPITKYMGASIGLLPFSSVGYSFGNEIVNGSNSYEGFGGLNQLYAGLSGRLFNHLNIGVNASFLFGTTVNDIYANTGNGGSTLFERVTQVRDWRLQAGIQYDFYIGANNKFTIGAVFTPEKKLLGETYGIKWDINNDEKPDTLGKTKTNDKYSLPNCWGGGINYQWRDRLMVEADFTYQEWGKAKYSALEGFDSNDLENANERFDNRWEVSVGAQYTPRPRGNYFQRMQYRLGGFFNHDYQLIYTKDVNNNSLKNNIIEYGVSAGVGLPINGFKTMINIGLEYRHRQANPNPLIKEDYLNITLGVNFNEMWFWKNKLR